MTLADDLLDRGLIRRDRARKRQARLIPFEKFEPLLFEIRSHFNCSRDEALRLIGYAGATTLSDWRRYGTPMLASNAARGVLAIANLPQPMPPDPPEPDFTFEELTELFALLRGYQVGPAVRKLLIGKVARLLAEDAEE